MLIVIMITYDKYDLFYVLHIALLAATMNNAEQYALELNVKCMKT